MSTKKLFSLAVAVVFCLAAAYAAGPVNGKRITVVSGGGYFPVLIQLKNGELMAVLRGGAPHLGVKGRLDIVTSKDHGLTWSPPRTVVDGPEDDRNPALGQLKNGDIILAYAVLHGYDHTGLKLNTPDRHAEGVYVIRSRDGGRSWSKPKRSKSTHKLQKSGGDVSPYGKIVQLADGTALMSVYYEFRDARGNQDYVFRSRDNGKTWGDPTLVGEHYNETGLLALKGGTVLAALRSEIGGHLATSSSIDGGKTWSQPVQITKDREHPGDLIQLDDGDVLLTYGERNKPFGVQAVLSHDDGKTWSASSKTVLADDAPSADCGYPSSVQLPDGKIVTVYYHVDDPSDAPASTKATAVIWTAP
jgi:Neuraminidase (sialidase)